MVHYFSPGYRFSPGYFCCRWHYHNSLCSFPLPAKHLIEVLCPSEWQQNTPIRHQRWCKCSQNAYEGIFFVLQTFNAV